MKKTKKVKKKAGKRKPFKLNLEYNKSDYTKYSKQAARVQYWMALLLLTICNLLIFAILIPFILILQASHLLIIIGSIGFVFGLIYNFLIHDIEHLEPRHHRFAAGFIPLVAIINIYLLMKIGSFLKGWYFYDNTDILYASLVYVALFILPYAFGAFKKKF